ncbi:MAG: hypothetical protein FWD37_04070 [Methanomassiliicoccaceae archaeon]|nr:hypothetical protein [Methanomassiliicoccaceae archaeon]
MSENRVDPTVAGLFLVAFITLVFGLLGLDLFQNFDVPGYVSDYLLFAGGIIPTISLVLLVFAYMAGKVGNAFAVALFAFVAVALFAVTIAVAGGAGTPFVALAFFFLLFTLVAFFIGAPKLLVLMLLFVTFLFLFVGLFFIEGEKAYAIAFGLFGILSFLAAGYLALALSTQKFPVF